MYVAMDAAADTVTVLDPAYGTREMSVVQLHAAMAAKEGGDNALDKAGRARPFPALVLLEYRGTVPHVEYQETGVSQTAWRLTCPPHDCQCRSAADQPHGGSLGAFGAWAL